MLTNIISKQLGFASQKVKNVLELLDGGATIPFIARYRKEATGSMDEVAIGNIKEMYEKLKAIVERKQTIIATIEEQGKLTPELKALSFFHHGAYEEISEARKRLLAHAEENNLTLTGVFRNIYLEGPPQHKDKSKFITQIIAIIE